MNELFQILLMGAAGLVAVGARMAGRGAALTLVAHTGCRLIGGGNFGAVIAVMMCDVVHDLPRYIF